MRTKLILFTVALCLSTGCAAQSIRTYNDADLLKNYALAKCMGMTHKSLELKRDTDATAQGYLEFGNVDFQAYEEAVSLARTYLGRKYVSKSGDPLKVMKCIDLYHSHELELLVRKYVAAERKARG